MSRRSRNSQSRSHRGFTLVEVLATLVLLGIVLPATMQAVSSALHAASVAKHRTEAASLGQAKLNELLVTGEWYGVSSSGDFGQEWPEYRWSCRSGSADTGITELSLDVVWIERGQEQSLNLSTLVADVTDPTLVTTTTTTQ
jgi:general secretion pathway protein I